MQVYRATCTVCNGGIYTDKIPTMDDMFECETCKTVFDFYQLDFYATSDTPKGNNE
jgi:hypothetical protein